MVKEKERFGKFVRRKRQEKDISLKDMAQRLGVSGTYLSKVERDEYLPPKDAIKAIAKIIRCDLNELLKLTVGWVRQEPAYKDEAVRHSRYNNVWG